MWAVFPVKFAVYMAGAMSLEVDVVIGLLCDIGAKVWAPKSHINVHFTRFQLVVIVIISHPS